MAMACPICGKTDRVEVLTSKSEEQAGHGAWSCGYCHHAWRTEPWRLTDPVEFFRKASYTKIENAERLDATKMKLFEKFLQWANEVKPQPPRTMVDFGCSYGTVTEMFKKDGWDVMGIEISPTAQKILNERNLPWAASLEDSGLTLGSVDVVVMSDCSYYLPDPVGTLRTIRSYMQPNGLLFLRQPTRGGFVCLLSGMSRKKALANKLWLDHVHLFSHRSTRLALEQAGFVEVKFLIERKFRRSLKGEIIHCLLRAVDFVTLGFFDLTLSWTVIAKAEKNVNIGH